LTGFCSRIGQHKVDMDLLFETFQRESVK
jgi:hypothetical protein